MALDFTLSATPSIVAANAPTTVTITLTGTGALASTATFTATGAGTPSAAPTMLTGAVAGASVTFTWTAALSGVLTVTASGGLVAFHTLPILVAAANAVCAMQIIDEANGLLGVRDPDANTDSTQAASFLTRMNMLIDSWRLESGFAYATQAISGTIKAGAQSITIGPTGDIVTAYRPVQIEAGSTFRSGTLDYAIDAITNAQYAQIPYKTYSTLGPDAMNYTPTLPNGTLSLYPQASADVTITLIALLEATEFQDLFTFYTLAPGYKRALAYSLAEEMAPDFQIQLHPQVSKAASLARRAIKRSNHATPAISGYLPRGNIVRGWEI